MRMRERHIRYDQTAPCMRLQCIASQCTGRRIVCGWRVDSPDPPWPLWLIGRCCSGADATAGVGSQAASGVEQCARERRCCCRCCCCCPAAALLLLAFCLFLFFFGPFVFDRIESLNLGLEQQAAAMTLTHRSNIFHAYAHLLVDDVVCSEILADSLGFFFCSPFVPLHSIRSA